MIRYRKGYKYQLAVSYDADLPAPFIRPDVIETEYITLRAGWLHIKAGYSWDGASGPTLDTPPTMRGSLEHDALYQLMRQGHLPRNFQMYADRRLEQVCIEDGMWPLRAKIWRQGLGLFGGSNTDPVNAKRILEAP